MKKPLQMTLTILPFVLGLALAQSSSIGSTPTSSAKNPVEIAGSTFVVSTVDDKGKKVEKLVEGDKAVPGNVLEMRQKITNNSDRRISGIVLKMPISSSTLYQTQKCDTAGIEPQFSIDKGKTFASAPLKKKVTVTENGKSVTKEVEVSPSEYQYIQWKLPALDAKKSIQCHIRATVK